MLLHDPTGKTLQGSGSPKNYGRREQCHGGRSKHVEAGSCHRGGRPLTARAISAITKRMMNTTNRNCAIPAEAPAIPPNPKSPAIKAITRKARAHPSISVSPLRCWPWLGANASLGPRFPAACPCRPAVARGTFHPRLRSDSATSGTSLPVHSAQSAGESGPCIPCSPSSASWSSRSRSSISSAEEQTK